MLKSLYLNLNQSFNSYPRVYIMILIIAITYVYLQTQQIKENFCIFGCGGSKSKTEVDIDNTIMNTVTSEYFSKQLQQHQASAAAVNAIKIKGIKGDVTITDSSFKAYANVSLDSWQKMQTDQQVKALIQTVLKQSMKASTKAESSTLGGLLGQATKTTSDLTLKNQLINDTVNKFTVEQINQCIASAFAKNVIQIDDVEGNVTINGLDMNATADTAAKCLGDQIVKQATQVANDTLGIENTNVTTTSTQKSLLDSIFGNLFGNLGSLALYGIIAAVAIFVILLIIFILYLTLGRSSKKVQIETYPPQ